MAERADYHRADYHPPLRESIPNILGDYGSRPENHWDRSQADCHRIDDGQAYDIPALRQSLKGLTIGGEIIYAEELNSTNDYIKQARGSLSNGAVVLAGRQLAGRGRNGRVWYSESRAGIFVSVLLKAGRREPSFTLAAGLAVTRAVRLLGLPAGIKWPNDCVIDGKKFAGILTETQGMGDFLAVGIGVNVNNSAFPEDIAEKAVSLALAAGRRFSRQDVLADILRQLNYVYKPFMEGGFAVLRDEYLRHCVTVGAEVRLGTPLREGSSETARAVDISPSGGLVVVNGSGARREVLSGEISVRGLDGNYTA
ncbi:MAG: biotin--[acetyl-CoA-carboxylase] ligase [Clostridiales bacterium]|jgi:BirA family biotin operon repressor/biotin-[acetyl-CoA-carboxylase] ligase|nr:biotin--[acetyl-CoA-carboxylase] ligase [Clostridiales bacterium]